MSLVRELLSAVSCWSSPASPQKGSRNTQNRTVTPRKMTLRGVSVAPNVITSPSSAWGYGIGTAQAPGPQHSTARARISWHTRHGGDEWSGTASARHESALCTMPRVHVCSCRVSHAIGYVRPRQQRPPRACGCRRHMLHSDGGPSIRRLFPPPTLKPLSNSLNPREEPKLMAIS